MEFLKKPDLKFRGSRRKFLGVSAVILGSLALLKKIVSRKDNTKKTIRLLTHDGRLVETYIKNLPVKKKLVTKSQLVSWVWNNQSLKH